MEGLGQIHLSKIIMETYSRICMKYIWKLFIGDRNQDTQNQGNCLIIFKYQRFSWSWFISAEILKAADELSTGFPRKGASFISILKSGKINEEGSSYTDPSPCCHRSWSCLKTCVLPNTLSRTSTRVQKSTYSSVTSPQRILHKIERGLNHERSAF